MPCFWRSTSCSPPKSGLEMLCPSPPIASRGCTWRGTRRTGAAELIGMPWQTHTNTTAKTRRATKPTTRSRTIQEDKADKSSVEHTIAAVLDTEERRITKKVQEARHSVKVAQEVEAVERKAARELSQARLLARLRGRTGPQPTRQALLMRRSFAAPGKPSSGRTSTSGNCAQLRSSPLDASAPLEQGEAASCSSASAHQEAAHACPGAISAGHQARSRTPGSTTGAGMCMRLEQGRWQRKRRRKTTLMRSMISTYPRL